MTVNEFNRTRKAAVDALIYWAKKNMGELAMRESVDKFLESCGANHPCIGGEETILAHRKMAVNRLAIDCAYALSKEECSKVDSELEVIAADFQSNKRSEGSCWPKNKQELI